MKMKSVVVKEKSRRKIKSIMEASDFMGADDSKKKKPRSEGMYCDVSVVCSDGEYRMRRILTHTRKDLEQNGNDILSAIRAHEKRTNALAKLLKRDRYDVKSVTILSLCEAPI